MNKRFKTYVKEWWKRHIVDNDPFEINKTKKRTCLFNRPSQNKEDLSKPAFASIAKRPYLRFTNNNHEEYRLNCKC